MAQLEHRAAGLDFVLVLDSNATLSVSTWDKFISLVLLFSKRRFCSPDGLGIVKLSDLSG